MSGLPFPTERQIQDSVVRYARLTGWHAWELLLGSAGNGRVYATKGLPDLYLFRSGKALWMELKRGNQGRVSPHQQQRHNELRLCGLPIYVCRSLDEARTVLDAARGGQP